MRRRDYRVYDKLMSLQQQQQLPGAFEGGGGGSGMGECRGGGDCLIKLFGKTIPVTEAADAKDVQHTGNSSSSSSTEPDAKGNNRHQDTLDPPPQPEVVDPEDPENSQHPGGDGEASHRGKLKKPDKVLPCPRCDSTDTKFCYFNNYNVNQPRHFCKNCQRYWTAGGAMRNVPVGAGRRKNKGAVAAASHFIHRVRAALPAAAGDPLRRTASGAVLSFGHGDDLEEQRVDHMKKERLLLPIGNAGDRQSARPCSVGSSNRDDKNPSGIVREKVTVDKPANEAQQHPANMNGGATMWPYSRAPSQAHYPPGVAVPTTYYPATPGYWVCMVPGGWSLPWPVQSPTQGLLSSLTSVSSGADSLTLGKHAREGDEEGRSHGSGRVWTPKTIRIDDVDEVAKSSVWSLIGVKGDKQNADTDGRRHGTVFEPKHDAKTAKQATIASSPLQLHANPVALTRSLTFQEGS